MIPTDKPEGATADIPNLEELLARIAPPDTPTQAISLAPDIVGLVSRWHPEKAVKVLSGLMTDPRFQAHLTRLDWAVRLVLGIAGGSRRPKRADLDQLLNIEFSTGRVTMLEDPVEDFFVESLPTRSGDFLIFSGFWEKASIHTEMILEAFERLPDAPEKTNAQRKAIALLRLGDAIVQRANLSRRVVGSGLPKGNISIPSDERLNALGQRVRFSWAELAAMSIDRADLEDFFFIKEEDAVPVLQWTPGNSPMERRPLLHTDDGLIVLAPANISTAVRSALIDVAVNHNLGRALQVSLMSAHGVLLQQSNFKLIPFGKVSRIEDYLYAEAAAEISPGRYVHIIQTVDGFGRWPADAFGSTVPCAPALVERVLSGMRSAREAFRANDDFVEGMTLWIAGGWGAGRSLEFDRDADDLSWPFIMLEPADAALLNACEDGTPADWWRLEKQTELVRRQGFDLFNMSGFVNLFQWWRNTDHALVPPGEIDITPPITIEFGTDLILEPRREGAENLDRRAVLHPSGNWHLVARLERGPLALPFGQVYGSLDDAINAKLTGVALSADSTWWVELDRQADHSEDTFETWRTALLWAGRVMAPVLASLPKRGIVPNLLFTLKLEPLPPNTERYAEESLGDDQIDRAVTVAIDQGRTAAITLGVDWHRGFYRPDNYAEVLLGTALGWAAARLCGSGQTRDQIKNVVRGAVGSVDYRHRHAFRVERAIDRLDADGLLESFRPIPISASALAKCGSIWVTHPRDRGVRITGKDACIELVAEFVKKQEELLRTSVGEFNRKNFILTALEGFQSAVAQEGKWGRSARALRAIHGAEEDFRMSLDAVKKANGVLRANSMLVELASAEGRRDGGLAAGQMDMEELQARALQVFMTADLLPALHSDRISPDIHLSPTGEIRYHHEFEDKAVRFAAELRHASHREHEHADYVDRFSKKSAAKSTNQDDLKSAIAAEYGVPAELVPELATVLAMVAAKRGSGVYSIRRSELVTEVRAIDYLRDYDAGPLIDRLTMPIRNGWDDLPPGSVAADFDLARFDRPLAAIGRPIMILQAGDDPELAIAPGVIERAVIHNVMGAANGSLQDRFWSSPAMRSYTGKVASRLGLEFNESVADKLRELDLRAWPSAAPSWCLNQKRTEEVARLGDIDVLAASPNNEVVWVVEAKDLKLCRTLGEAARRLSDYRGQMKRKGTPDELLKHLRRVDYLRRHAASLVGRLKLPGPPKVCGVLIVSSPQPMQQLQHESSADATVVMLDKVESVPWATGW
jgi:hypothetical protein